MYKKVLLVEGKTDEAVTKAICYQLKESKVCYIKDFDIKICDNDRGVARTLKTFLQSSDKPEVIGVLIDADKNIEKPTNNHLLDRWNQIKTILNAKNIEAPKSPDKKGTIIPAEKMKIGVWLMPNNSESGMIEDFLKTMITDYAKDIIKTSIDIAKESEITTFKDVHYSKAMVHTYLAWQDEPGCQLGLAIKTKKLIADNELANNFANWLKALFD